MNAFAAAIDDEVLVTADGYRQLCAELETLRTVRRQELTEYLRDARGDRDPDNPMLFDLLEEQAKLEGRIKLLDAQVAVARIADPATDGTAGIGSCVRVRDCDSNDVAEYNLVGPIEADVGDGRVSIEAPVGRALLGRRGGETVTVETPRGTAQLELLSVRSIGSPKVKLAA
jgi:transcription elongation factor GreA